MDAFALSAKRSEIVARQFIRNGVQPDRISTVFYGDNRPDEAFKQSSDSPQKLNRRVEFTIRKTDLSTKGHKVQAQ